MAHDTVKGLDRVKVKEVIENLACERLGNAIINSVDVNEDVDFDGDEILRVEVVFTAEDDRLDPGLTLSFVRHLRPKLSEIGVGHFPVMSYISHNDFEETAA